MTTTPEPAEKRPRFTRLDFLRGTLVLVILGCFAIIPLLPFLSRKESPSAETQNLYNAQKMAIACVAYAAQHEGRFPMHLNELVPTYLSAEDMAAKRYIVIAEGKGTKITADWLYFGAGFTVTKPPMLLIAAPQGTGTKGNFRVYAHANTAAYTAKDYDDKLKTTIEQMKALGAGSKDAPASDTPPTTQPPVSTTPAPPAN